jgi:hypothetical protein
MLNSLGSTMGRSEQPYGRFAASGPWGRPGSANRLRIAGVLGVADRPGQPLDELGCRVVVLRCTDWTCSSSQTEGVGGQRGWIGGDDDSWHPKLLSGLGGGLSDGTESRTPLRFVLPADALA